MDAEVLPGEVYQPGLLSVGHADQIELDRYLRQVAAGVTLADHVAGLEELPRFKLRDGVQAQEARALGERPLVGARLVVPVPARIEHRLLEAVSYTHLTLPTNREV